MVRFKQIMVCLAMGIAAAGWAAAQSSNQVQLKIEAANRTLTVTAEERVTADPELAIPIGRTPGSAGVAVVV